MLLACSRTCYVICHPVDLRTTCLQELLWASAVTRAPLLVVVVPALPKGAAVELHVTAVDDDPTKRTSCHLTAEVAWGSIECDTVLSADSRSASLSLCLAVHGEHMEAPDVKQAAEEVGTMFRKATETMEAELVPQCARLFFKCSHSLAQQLVTGTLK